MQTLGERIKFIQKNSGKIQPDFAESVGVSKGSLILYQKNERSPDSSFLQTLCQKYQVNPTWLLMGEGEPFLQAGNEAKNPDADKVVPIDAAVQLLREAEDETGITLNQSQRNAILAVLRKNLDDDRRNVIQVINAFWGDKKGE